MDFEALTNLSWREALIAIVAMLVLYVVVAFWRIQRLKRRKAAINVVNSPESLAAQSAVAAYAAVQEPELPAAPEAVASKPPETAFPWNEPPPEIPGQRLIESLEREIAQLRKEVGGLRAEVLVLREQQQRELAQAKTVTPSSVSPLYSDAMQMAMQGNDAANISLQCGIARAEAELVVALVRNRDMQE